MVWMWIGCGVFAPAVEVTGVGLSHVTLEDVEVTAKVDVTNPWWSSFTLDALTWSLSVGSATLTSGELDKPVFVRPNGITTVEVPITLAYADLAAATRSLGAPEVPYRLALDVHATTPGGPWHWPVAIEGAIPKISPPTLDLVDWSATTRDGNLEVDVIVKLGLPEGFALHDGTWRLAVDEHRLGEGRFASRSEGELHLPLVVDPGGTTRAGWAWVNGEAEVLSLDVDGAVITPAGVVPLSMHRALRVGSERAPTPD